jgi:hypothetical protein
VTRDEYEQQRQEIKASLRDARRTIWSAQVRWDELTENLRNQVFERQRDLIKWQRTQAHHDIWEAQRVFDDYANQLHDLSREFAKSEHKRKMKEAEQRSLDRD